MIPFIKAIGTDNGHFIKGVMKSFGKSIDPKDYTLATKSSFYALITFFFSKQFLSFIFCNFFNNFFYFFSFSVRFLSSSLSSSSYYSSSPSSSSPFLNF
jgi:hypothetical protein